MRETIHDWLVGQDRIIEKFGYELINRKQEELCQNCKQRRPEPIPSHRDCLLLPITNEGEDCPYFSTKHMAGEPGFEPGLHGPEPCVLPLDDSPALQRCSNVTKSKSSPFPGLLNGILPSILPQKAAGIGQQIQSLLSNPLHCLDSLCNQSITLLILKSQLLKYQPAKGDAAGILFASPTIGQLYNILADNGKETIPLAAPPTLRDIRRSADETDRVAPSTLSRSVTEVASC